MKNLHLESLRPICPSCRLQELGDWRLIVGWSSLEDDEGILEGALQCTNPACLIEYPILDGIPILAPDPRTYISENREHLLQRRDLSPELQGMIGECIGPSSSFDVTRMHSSSYTWDHYAEFDTSGHIEESSQEEPRPGSIVGVLEAGLALLDSSGPKAEHTDMTSGPAIEIGCSVGRVTFELARRTQAPVVGIDLNFSMLRTAQEILRTGTVAYDRRDVGLIYERRAYPVPFEARANADFWVADAAALPFSDGAFSLAVGLNVLDSVASPLDLLRSAERILRVGGDLLVASPYDWTGSVTTPEAWIGGHSPRAPGNGESGSILRSLLTPGSHAASLIGMERIAEQADVPWTVRIHGRSHCRYLLDMVAARRLGPEDGIDG